jgi:hypothetical protein
MYKNNLPKALAYVLIFLSLILAIPIVNLILEVKKFSETIHYDFSK